MEKALDRRKDYNNGGKLVYRDTLSKIGVKFVKTGQGKIQQGLTRGNNLVYIYIKQGKRGDSDTN